MSCRLRFANLRKLDLHYQHFPVNLSIYWKANNSIHILPNILKSKDNQIRKFSQLKYAEHEAGTSSRPSSSRPTFVF